MSSLVLKNFSQRTRELAPGFVVSSVVAAAACFFIRALWCASHAICTITRHEREFFSC